MTLVCGALLFAAFPCALKAQDVVQGPPDAVQTYVNQALPPDVKEGAAWNRPYKAGELKLSKPKKPKEEPARVDSLRPKLPIGQLQAPKIPEAKTAPKLAAPPTSAASVMLLQGMKKALQEGGQNPALPKSSLTPAASNVAAPTLHAPVLGTGTMQVDEALPESGAAQPTELPLAAADEAPTPKATELEHPPVPLEQIGNNPNAPIAEAPHEDAPSIFGAPVDETKPEIAAPAPVPVAKPCEEQVTAWTKSCVEAGYPADFSGQITGETRVVCPAGDARDVWLTNNCAAPVASLPPEPAPTYVEQPVAASTVETAEVASPPARVDASCGPVNGMAVSGKPAADLCQHGGASEVLGEGPWRWNCKGEYGGMTVSCAAAYAPKKSEAKDAVKADGAASLSTMARAPVAEDAKCGAADGAGTETAPSDRLCAKGIASRVNGNGPWTWACSGTNGGVAAACSAARKIDGLCGAANGAGADAMPQRDLCDAGFASAITGEGPWHWTCSGLYGGAPATCAAAPKVNAVCGAASLVGHREPPKDELCNAGQATAVTGEGPWHWTCSGNNGGAQVACAAPPVADGVCGAANGAAFVKAPDQELCGQGQPSRVTGTGPWNWNCGGLDGGSTASCTAVLAVPEPAMASNNVAAPLVATASANAGSANAACGSASEMIAFATPRDGLCASGKPSAVTGNGPWQWTCADGAGRSVSCSTLTATEGACGAAANMASAEAPDSNLCAAGAPSAVAKDGKDRWRWECEGSMGAASVTCSAPVGHDAPKVAMAEKAPEPAKCGVAAGRGAASTPDADLCETGKAGLVRGKGPWTWACATKSGDKIRCEAPKIVEGQCGAANSSVRQGAPDSALCDAGSPTAVTGQGPWLWSCIGAGGGSSVSCSATAQSQTRVDGTCGVAANATMIAAPSVNLCDSGVPSNVYGEGPWTWTCSGLNGGIASTCATNKSVPKAPPPPGPAVNGNCGTANGVAAVDQPEEGLCSSGTVTSVSGHGPWNWSCLGANGGMTVSCTAPLVPPAPIVGACGNASGVTTMTMPRSGLCAAGIASAVSGKGPWVWSCSGTNGGGAVACVAPVAGKGGVNAPMPSLVTPSEQEDEAPAPRAAPAGLVTPRLPSGPLPPLKSGAVPRLKSSRPSDPVAGIMLPSPPPSDLSDAGPTPSAAPNLPAETEPLIPPPIRDTLKPSSALKPPAIDSEGVAVSGARFQLPAEVATLSFQRDSDAIAKDVLPLVNKLAAILISHGNVRITLTAYADNSNITPREARRLSLSRALAVRDYLTTKGVSSGRIDVRALGANVASGDADRVDVKVN